MSNNSKSIFYSHDSILVNGGGGAVPTDTLSSSASSSSLSSTSASTSNFLPGLESVVQAQLKIREHEYVDLKPFRILCATWNVNGKGCSEPLTDWLSSDKAPPDIYAIGFQELDLSKEAFLFTDSPREEEWFNACAACLHPSAKYYEVRRIRLIGMMIIVFAKMDHLQLITNVAAESVGTGLLGRMVSTFLTI